MNKKNNLIKVYLRNPWYNKSCIKALIKKRSHSHAIAHSITESFMNDARIIDTNSIMNDNQ